MASPWMNKHILVTGGTGFLGHHLCAALEAQEANVVPLSSKDADLRQPFPLDVTNFDMIFHLAAKVSGIRGNRLKPFEHLYDNVLMSSQIVRYALDSLTPIVAAGSVCVYSNEARLPFREGDIFVGLPEHTNFGYGMSKRMLLSALMAAYQQNFAFQYAFVNTANLYGPGDNFGENAHVIPDLIKKVHASPKNGNKVKIFGSGNTTRDFLYVDDAVNAYLAAGEFLMDEGVAIVCNVGSGTEVSIRETLGIICNVFGRTPDVVSDGSNIDGQQRRLVDSSLAKSQLGWRPSVGLRQGIERTIEWYIDNQEDTEGVARIAGKKGETPY